MPRKAMSQPMPGARPQASEARVNTHSPMMKTRLAPVEVAEPARGNEQHGEHQQVGVHHPLHLGEACVEGRP